MQRGQKRDGNPSGQTAKAPKALMSPEDTLREVPNYIERLFEYDGPGISKYQRLRKRVLSKNFRSYYIHLADKTCSSAFNRRDHPYFPVRKDSDGIELKVQEDLYLDIGTVVSFTHVGVRGNNVVVPLCLVHPSEIEGKRDTLLDASLFLKEKAFSVVGFGLFNVVSCELTMYATDFEEESCTEIETRKIDLWK
jgi:hypothetical protein